MSNEPRGEVIDQLASLELLWTQAQMRGLGKLYRYPVSGNGSVLDLRQFAFAVKIKTILTAAQMRAFATAGTPIATVVWNDGQAVNFPDAWTAPGVTADDYPVPIELEMQIEGPIYRLVVVSQIAGAIVPVVYIELSDIVRYKQEWIKNPFADSQYLTAIKLATETVADEINPGTGLLVRNDAPLSVYLTEVANIDFPGGMTCESKGLRRLLVNDGACDA